MPAHLGGLLRRQRPGLVEHAVRDADLADVVQRREARQQIDALAASGSRGTRGASTAASGEQARVLLRAPRVTAGLGIADLGQRQQRLHHQTLRGRLLLARARRAARSTVNLASVITASVSDHGRRRRPAEKRTAARDDSIQAEPHQKPAISAAAAEHARGHARAADDRGDGSAGQQHDRRDRRPSHTPSDGRSPAAADCRPSSPALRRRRTACRAASPRPRACRAPSCRPARSFPAARRRPPSRSARRRPRHTGSCASSRGYAEQQVAPAVERNREISNRQGRRVDGGHAKRRTARAGGRRHGRQREAWIDAAVELGEERSAPKNAIGVGRGVEKPGARRGLRQHGEIAHRTGGLEERIGRLIARRLEDGDPERVQQRSASPMVRPRRTSARSRARHRCRAARSPAPGPAPWPRPGFPCRSRGRNDPTPRR